ncbi:helix-turn-helix domain-containing protein [Sinomonas susongensis]|uniref:helix-turn-helix domain-containing protein n=1 Tax=Sinomonas susongensis TaxID=1324851 RepID=UPI0011081501|nr:helix-turn-helix domain-containing protein [Sinomonas susongensis]
MRQLEAVAAATTQLAQNEQWKPHQEPKPRYRLNDRLGLEVLDQIVARYEAGEPTTALAAEFGVAKSSLLRLLEVRGIAMRNQRLTSDQKQQILQLRKQGTAIRAIAARVGCSYGTTQAFLKVQSDPTSR